MGFFIKNHPTPRMVQQMVELACCNYTQAHDEDQFEVVVNHDEETIIVNGTFTECFVFSQFI